MSAMDESEVMDRRKFFIAAMEGNIGFFEEARNKEIENCDEVYFLRQTSSLKYNILHIAIKYRQYEFIKIVFVEGLLPPAVTEKLINQQDSEGNTPLHAAAEEGHIVALELLLEYRKVTTKLLDWSVKNNDGNTPLHLALINRKVEAAEWLVKQHPEVAGVANNEGNTPLHIAAEVGARSIFELLHDENVQWQPMLRMQNKQGNTALHVAIINYNWDEIATLLLKQDPELAGYTNNSKQAPLHLAIIIFPPLGLKKYTEGNKYQGWSRISMEVDLESAAKKGDVGFLEEAQKREVENELYYLGQNSSGDNILHIAIRSEHNEFIERVTKMLPTSVIDKLINQSNINGDTLFHVAAKMVNIPIFKLLLQFDKSRKNDVRNSSGNTPSEIAISTVNPHLMEVVNFSAISGTVRWYLIERLVITDSSMACWHDENGLTPLHRAASLDCSIILVVIKLMLEYCPESAKEVEKDSGKTVLHFLINRISTYQRGKELLQLSEIAPLMGVKDKQGNTPFDMAWKFNYKMARVLLDYSSVSTSDITHIQQLNDDFEQMKIKKKSTLEEHGIIDGVNIQFIKGKISKFGINLLFSRDSKRRNLLHNLMSLERRTPIVHAEYLEFVLQVVDTYPKLVGQTDII